MKLFLNLLSTSYMTYMYIPVPSHTGYKYEWNEGVCVRMSVCVCVHVGVCVCERATCILFL